VRPRNAIVQLMKQTGTMQGSARQIARYMSGLMQTGKEADQQKAFELAEKAIDRMGKKMERAPLTYDGLIESLKNLREQLYETVGGPMLQALKGPLNQLKSYFEKHRVEIEKWAYVVGEQVGVWITQAAEHFRNAFQFVQDHAEEIKDALVTGARMLKDALEFMVANRAIFTAISLGNSAMSLGGAAAGALGLGGAAAAEGGVAAVGGGLALKGATMGLEIEETAAAASMGILSTGIVATTAAVGAAVGAWALAGWQAKKLHGELGSTLDAQARWVAAEKAAKAGDIEETKRMKDALGNLNLEETQHINHLIDMAAQRRSTRERRSLGTSAHPR
jgi:hypothetical protein